MQNITKEGSEVEVLHVPLKRKPDDQYSDVQKKCFKGKIIFIS